MAYRAPMGSAFLLGFVGIVLTFLGVTVTRAASR
jgi:hypothetical protein